MTTTLKDEIETLINRSGKMSRTRLYCQFELVAKRAIDNALEDLARTNRIVLGASEVAPVRASRREAAVAVFGESATYAYSASQAELDRERERRARPERTLPDRLLEALKGGEAMTVRELQDALVLTGPRVPEREVRKALSRLKGNGVDNPSWGRWILDSAALNQRGVSLRKRLLAIFEPGVMLSRPQIRERLKDANDGSVSDALAGLVADGKLCNKRARGYWLPEHIEEGAAA